MPFHRSRGALVGAVLALAAASALPAAQAHAHLESAQPAPDSKNPDVRELRLKFSEAVEGRLSSIHLEDREDRAVVEPQAELDPADHKVLVVRLYDALPPGRYRLRWAVVSADGHRVNGDYYFLVSR